MNLYIEDLERIITIARVHESINRKFGKNPLCTMNAIDIHGNTLGILECDQFGKSYFKINPVGKK